MNNISKPPASSGLLMSNSCSYLWVSYLLEEPVSLLYNLSFTWVNRLQKSPVKAHVPVCCWVTGAQRFQVCLQSWFLISFFYNVKRQIPSAGKLYCWEVCTMFQANGLFQPIDWRGLLQSSRQWTWGGNIFLDLFLIVLSFFLIFEDVSCARSVMFVLL